MEIKLNAAPEASPAPPPSASHAVSMSSLLSDDVGTPRDAVHSPPGLSSLMNVADDVQSPVSGAPAPKLATLQTPELQTLQTQLHISLEKLWGETGPVSKRQKKSKQSRRAKAAADNSADVYKALKQLQRIINTQFARRSVLEDVVKFSLSFCELLDEKDPVQGLVVLDHEKKRVDLDETLAKLPSKPLYAQLVGAIRRAVLSAGDLIGKELLIQVLDWSLTRSTPENWTWLMASIAQMNSYFVQEFLFREAMARHEEMKWFILLLEFLATKYPAQMVDILREVLEECASNDQGRGLETVRRLVALASDSAVLVKVCDENLQWIVTEELVTTLSSKFQEGDMSGNGNTSLQEGIDVVLLDFIRKRSAELSNSGFQLLLLLQDLSTAKLSSRFAASVASFQKQVVEFAGSETSCAFIKGIYRFLPYICQSTLRLLQLMSPGEEVSDVNMTGDEEMSKETAHQRFDEWKQWLCLLAQSISRKEVTEQLIKAELMLAEFNEVPVVYPLTTIQDADRALCELLTSLLTPASPEYVAFVRNIIHECQSAAPRARRRILGIIQTLLHLNDTEVVDTENELPVNLSGEQRASCMQQLARAKSWGGSLDSFELWKETLKRVLLAAAAISSRSRSTGDKISSELSVPEVSALQSRLQTLKMVLFRVLALDGGVAHYSSSVYSMFASLWLDALSVPHRRPLQVHQSPVVTGNHEGSRGETGIPENAGLFLGAGNARGSPEIEDRSGYALGACGAVLRIPSDDIYKDMLPNRSSFDVDLRVEQWLNHFPAFLPLLRAVISTSTVLGSSQLLRLVPVFKSVLIVLLGHWNSVKGELSVENIDVPPITGLSTGGSSSSSSNPPLEFYLIPIRKALHRNIRKIGANVVSIISNHKPYSRLLVSRSYRAEVMGDVELLLVRIDHFGDRVKYVSVLREWLQELQIANGRVVSMGSDLQLLFIASTESQNSKLLDFYRSRDIDTNSRGDLCVDKFIDVLGRKNVESCGCKGFLEMNVLSATLLQKVLVHEWHAEQEWLDTALATKRTKTFLEWKEAAKAARKERRKKEGQEKQQERDVKRTKREQEAEKKALDEAAEKEADVETEDSEQQTAEVTEPLKQQGQKRKLEQQQQQPSGPKKSKNKKRRNKPTIQS
ncbi:hypothetical protein GQ600_18369 [Phytophthora cactorum]|nr:hypothetical protein GQ600_18369 [Phytophthora cactorum]